jgi:hypothetical protein
LSSALDEIKLKDSLTTFEGRLADANHSSLGAKVIGLEPPGNAVAPGAVPLAGRRSLPGARWAQSVFAAYGSGLPQEEETRACQRQH